MTLTLASILSGLLATLVMIAFLYLPTLWKGLYYDTLGSIGSALLDRTDTRARLVGSSVLIVGGIVFAVFYGWFTLMFLRGPFLLPDYTVFAGTPLAVNLFFPLFGFVLGLCQGVFISLIGSFAVADHHPDKSYRQGYPLVASFVIGHCVYGTLVMLLQSVFLA
jgi:hypothetical protein